MYIRRDGSSHLSIRYLRTVSPNGLSHQSVDLSDLPDNIRLLYNVADDKIS